MVTLRRLCSPTDALERNTPCFVARMTLKKHMKRRFGKKAARRIVAAMPWVGGALAVVAGAVLQKRRVREAMENVPGIPAFGKARRSASTETDLDNELVNSR